MIPPHTVSNDPGTIWAKDTKPAVDTPPDGETDPAPESAWPASAARTGIYGVVTPHVVPAASDGWRMYYTQILPRPGYPAGANDYDNATTRILSATSAEGVTWSPEAGVRLTASQGGAGDYRVVSPEVVPLTDGSERLRMYFECNPGAQSVASSIRSALSDDGGTTWAVEPGERFSAGGSYNSPRIIFLDDGRWRLYCSDRGVGIVSAISEDGGVTFEREAGERIVPTTSYEAMTTFAPEVLRITGGGYRMYFAGYSAMDCAHVLSATSEDGLHWDKEPEPVIAPGGPLDRSKCSEMCVMPIETNDGPAFRMFYEACDGTAPDERGVWRIISATAGPATLSEEERS